MKGKVERKTPHPVLFGSPAVPDEIRVTLFVDEIKPSDDSRWAYLCVLSVPTSRLNDALDRLSNDRRGFCHEMRFSDIQNCGEKQQIAERWLARVMTEPELWYFGILGLDFERLNRRAFGNQTGDQVANAHRRFLRSLLLYHLKSTHASCGNQVVVDSVYHDSEGRLEQDPWFSWHPIELISAHEDCIRFKANSIVFVDSDHKKEKSKPKISHFIQLCDVILGATRDILDQTSQQPGRKSVAAKFRPLIERINDPQKYNNPKSRYQYHQRCHLSFFPSRQLRPDS